MEQELISSIFSNLVMDSVKATREPMPLSHSFGDRQITLMMILVGSFNEREVTVTTIHRSLPRKKTQINQR